MGRGPTIDYHKDMADGYVKGTLTCLASHYIKKNVNTDFPLVLNIEPTNNCNLKCYICPRNNNVRKVGYMDFKLFKRIIDECKEYKKLKMINFHKDGESLLHPQIYEMIGYANEAGIAQMLHMNTNGLLLSEKHYEDFLNSGIDDVTISVDAARPGTFKKLKGVDALKQIENNIKGLFAYRKEKKYSKPFIRVKIMEFADIANDEMEEFINKWKDVADDVQVTGVHDWSGAIKGVKITDEIRPCRHPCVLLWYALAVNWDGKVSACNVDWDLSAVVGDLSGKTLHELWMSDKIKQLRRAEVFGAKRPAHVCEKCVVWTGGEDMTDWFLEKKEFYS